MHGIVKRCHGSRDHCHMIDFTGADLSDYFNYGFTEETWKQYCEKQRKTRYEVSQLNKIAVSHGTHPDSRSLASYSLHPGRICSMYSNCLADVSLGSSESCVVLTTCHYILMLSMFFFHQLSFLTLSRMQKLCVCVCVCVCVCSLCGWRG